MSSQQPPPVWFITAASSGFGHEIAVAALKRGHTVVAAARNPARIQDLAGAGAHTLALDVTWPVAAIEGVAEAVFAEHGRVDYLINAAGHVLVAAIEEATPEEVYHSFNTNVFGTINTIRAFLPHLRAQPVVAATGTRATVATFGSLASWMGLPGVSIYCMTKWCTSALGEALAGELQPFAIRATVVEPGHFRTGLLNPGVLVTPAQPLDAYGESTPCGQTRSWLAQMDRHQDGDVKKGSEVLVDVLTGTGVASGRELPVRVLLGSDAEDGIRQKCTSTTRLLDEWSEITRSTDYAKDQ